MVKPKREKGHRFSHTLDAMGIGQSPLQGPSTTRVKGSYLQTLPRRLSLFRHGWRVTGVKKWARGCGKKFEEAGKKKQGGCSKTAQKSEGKETRNILRDSSCGKGENQGAAAYLHKEGEIGKAGGTMIKEKIQEKQETYTNR